MHFSLSHPSPHLGQVIAHRPTPYESDNETALLRILMSPVITFNNPRLKKSV